MRRGVRPVFTMWPPSITTTARLFFAAAAIAFTTRRKSRATRTSGSDFRKAAKLRSVPGADANSAATTLFGRRSIGEGGGRGYRLWIRRWEVGLEIEIERAEGQLRFQLEHDAPVVVRQPYLRVTILGEDSLGLDHRLEDDRVKCSGGNCDPLLAENADSNRIPIRPEVAVKGVGLADNERKSADEVQERSIIEWLSDGFLLLRRLLRSLNKDAALGIDLEFPLDLLPAFLEALDETKRRQGLRVHPALVYIVHAVQEISALHPERGVPGGPAAEVVEPDDFHVRTADRERAELHVVLHSLAGSERNLCALRG